MPGTLYPTVGGHDAVLGVQSHNDAVGKNSTSFLQKTRCLHGGCADDGITHTRIEIRFNLIERTDATAHFNFGVFSDFFDHFTNERRIYGLTRLGTVQIHDMDAFGTQICPMTSLINGVFVIDRNVVFQIALTQTYATPFLQIDCRN